MERGVKLISAAQSPTLKIAVNHCVTVLLTNLAAKVLQAAKESDVCYCVDGAVCEDEACKIILKKHRDCDM